MSQTDFDKTDADAEMSDGRGMPFLDHLEELRWRILKSLMALIAGAAVCFAFSDDILKVLTIPYEDAVHSMLSARDSGPVEAIRQLLGQWVSKVTGADEGVAIREPKTPLPRARQLQALKPMTFFWINLQVALLGGFVVSLPVIFLQFWQFVAPGLLAREKRLMLPLVGLSVICFSVGALIAYGIVLPLGLRFFLGLEPPDMTSQWAVDEYISFVLRLLLGFGLVFEMPVITLFLSRLGLVTPALLRSIRRYAIVVIFLLAAIFTPPDPISQLLMAMPLLLLYEISIWVCRFSGARSRDDDEGEDADANGADGSGDGGSAGASEDGGGSDE